MVSLVEAFKYLVWSAASNWRLLSIDGDRCAVLELIELVEVLRRDCGAIAAVFYRVTCEFFISSSKYVFMVITISSTMNKSYTLLVSHSSSIISCPLRPRSHLYWLESLLVSVIRRWRNQLLLDALSAFSAVPCSKSIALVHELLVASGACEHRLRLKLIGLADIYCGPLRPEYILSMPGRYGLFYSRPRCDIIIVGPKARSSFLSSWCGHTALLLHHLVLAIGLKSWENSLSLIRTSCLADAPIP